MNRKADCHEYRHQELGLEPICFCLQLIELTHGICLNVVCNVDVGLHRLVVAVPRPLHHDLRRNAKGKCITDKGTATSMRTE